VKWNEGQKLPWIGLVKLQRAVILTPRRLVSLHIYLCLTVRTVPTHLSHLLGEDDLYLFRVELANRMNDDIRRGLPLSISTRVMVVVVMWALGDVNISPTYKLPMQRFLIFPFNIRVDLKIPH
jgi:hypothetical protein